MKKDIIWKIGGGESLLNSIYAYFNNVGFYGANKITEVIRDFIKIVVRERGKCMDDLYFLDVGCGNGYCTRIIAEYLENPKQVMGIEYSHNRLLHCKKMNSSIEYIWRYYKVFLV